MKLELDWKSVHSMSACDIQEYEALESWCELLHKERGRDLRILELGSYHGRSTTLLSQFGQVIALDTWGNIESGMDHYDLIGVGSFVPFIETVKRFKLVDRIIPIVASSECLDFFPDLFCDIVFHDGSHIYENVKKDILRLERHLNHAGLFCFHDHKRPGWHWPPVEGEEKRSDVDPWFGVSKSVDQLLEEGEYEIFEKVRGMVSLRRKQ